MQEQQIKNICTLHSCFYVWFIYGKAIDYMDIRLKELLLRCFFYP